MIGCALGVAIERLSVSGEPAASGVSPTDRQPCVLDLATEQSERRRLQCSTTLSEQALLLWLNHLTYEFEARFVGDICDTKRGH